MDAESEQRRETMARYGRAMYFAQCVEKQLAILTATTLKEDYLRVTPEDRERYFETEFQRTLGMLVAKIRAVTPVPLAIEGRLVRAVRLRNWLAHEYFWDRAWQILTVQGRAEMIVELDAAAEFLESLDGELTGVSDSWLARVGVSREVVEAEMLTHLAKTEAGSVSEPE
jgi:hypothetical protein